MTTATLTRTPDAVALCGCSRTPGGTLLTTCDHHAAAVAAQGAVIRQTATGATLDRFGAAVPFRSVLDAVLYCRLRGIAAVEA